MTALPTYNNTIAMVEWLVTWIVPNSLQCQNGPVDPDNVDDYGRQRQQYLHHRHD